MKIWDEKTPAWTLSESRVKIIAFCKCNRSRDRIPSDLLEKIDIHRKPGSLTQVFSYIDMLVEFSRPVGLFGLFSLQDRLEELFGRKVDLGTPDSLKPRLRSSVMSELVYVP
jgi:predicted nucleotidyltransferase